MKNIFFVILLCVGTIVVNAQWVVTDGIASTQSPSGNASLAYDWTDTTGHIFAISKVYETGFYEYEVDGKKKKLWLEAGDNNIGLATESTHVTTSIFFMDCMLGDYISIRGIGLFDVIEFTKVATEAATTENN
tara:strand:- start:327 stop:725 length:399 start_codon:yes stop_codon:yes gene_type:complete